MFKKNPVARVSEEMGFDTMINKVVDFWNRNFSWESGKFSPKNILESSDAKAEGRQDRQLEGEDGTTKARFKV